MMTDEQIDTVLKMSKDKCWQQGAGYYYLAEPWPKPPILSAYNFKVFILSWN